jgi:molybdenum cofactor cytidylyltransferase
MISTQNRPVRIAAVLLAAGEGRRMGGPKALLPIQGRSFLAHLHERFARAGALPVIAVLGHEAERVRLEAGLPSTAISVVNAGYRDGMLSSLLCGLDAAEAAGAEAVLVHPVDHPLVGAETVGRVVAALSEGARIAVPGRDGRRGHPGGFAASVWPALREAPRDRGARAVLAMHPDWIVHVEGDPGCLAGIDVPADYERWISPLDVPAADSRA